jgi:hypothetical protein
MRIEERHNLKIGLGDEINENEGGACKAHEKL